MDVLCVFFLLTFQSKRQYQFREHPKLVPKFSGFAKVFSHWMGTHSLLVMAIACDRGKFLFDADVAAFHFSQFCRAFCSEIGKYTEQLQIIQFYQFSSASSGMGYVYT